MVRVFILPSSSWPRISASFLHTRVAAGRLLVVVVMGSSFWEDIFTTLLLLYLLIQLLIASSSTCSTLIRLDTAENQTTPGAERNLTAKWDYTHKKYEKNKTTLSSHSSFFFLSFVLATSHDNIFNKKLRRRRGRMVSSGGFFLVGVKRETGGERGVRKMYSSTRKNQFFLLLVKPNRTMTPTPP